MRGGLIRSLSLNKTLHLLIRIHNTFNFLSIRKGNHITQAVSDLIKPGQEACLQTPDEETEAQSLSYQAVEANLGPSNSKGGRVASFLQFSFLYFFLTTLEFLEGWNVVTSDSSSHFTPGTQ